MLSLIRLVLADDHAVFRQSLRTYLEGESGFEVIGEAANGEEAVDLAFRLKPDVIVMDVSMPVLNGIDATKRIRASLKDVAILALTAYEYDQYVFALLEAGAAGYLLKDVSARDLADAIKAVHRGDSVLHPGVARKVIQRLAQGSQPSGGPQDTLTDREKEVLTLAAKGLRNKEIARNLFVSVRTVEAHLTSILTKLRVNSRLEAVLQGLREGLVTLSEISGK